MQYLYALIFGMCCFAAIYYVFELLIWVSKKLNNWHLQSTGPSLWQLTSKKVLKIEDERYKSLNILNIIGVKIDGIGPDPIDVLSLIKDEKRLRKVQKKLKMKAFW